MDYQFIQKLIDVHSGVRRRDREDYILHCIRVGEIMSSIKKDERLQKLAMLHDVLEVCPHVCHASLEHDFGLTPDEVEVIDILTAHEGESSRDHFQRVLSSQNAKALLIKYCDCKDNAIFMLDDYEFTRSVLGKDPVQEQTKYKLRIEEVLDALAGLGILLD